MRTRAATYVVLSSLLWATPGLSLAQDLGGTLQKTFTTDADFALGTFSGTRAGAPDADQLRIDTGSNVPPYFWVANAVDGIVTKVDTRTGRQVARYDSVLVRNWDNSVPSVRPPRDSCNYPVSTVVNARGDAYVVNRGNCASTFASITKYAGTLAACVDRNGNGRIDTSTDASGDGTINLSDTAEFSGQTDECILWTKNYTAVADPGRSIVVDADQNIWAAGTSSAKLYQLDGLTGAVLKTLDLKAETGSAVSIQALAVGPEGHLYSSDSSTLRLVWKIKPDAAAGAHVVDSLSSPVPTFGVVVDGNGMVWLGTDSDSATGLVMANFTAHTIQQVGANGGCSGRMHGVVVDGSGDIWAACLNSNRVLRVSSAGAAKGSWFVGTRPEGVSVAADGKIWATVQGSDTLAVVNPAVSTTIQSYAAGGQPYTFGDMTGYHHSRFVSRQGVWSAVHDSGATGTNWGTVRWNQEAQGATPTNTSITVKVRAANTRDALASQAFATVANNQTFAGIQGRYLEVQVTLRSVNFSGEPVLSDLSILSSNAPPVALCQNQDVCAGPACTAQVSINKGSYDPDGDAISLAQSPAGPYAIGSRAVSLTVSDSFASASCSGSVNVRDCEPPTITCGPPVQAECTGNQSASVSAGGADATDACSTVSVSGPGLASYPLGTSSVTYTATDAAGNTATCTTEVQVRDTLPPSITCPAPVTAECVGGGASNTSVGTASATDVCSPATVLAPGQASFPLGTASLTWSATDTSGNSASCTVPFTVADTQAPTVSLVGSSSQTLECGSSYTDPGTTATDACAGSLSARVVASGTVDPAVPGNYTRTYRVTDPSGNTSAEVTRTVKVQDTQGPSVTLNGPSSLTLNCSETFVDQGATAVDSCRGDVTDRVTVSGSVNSGKAGSYVLTYGATDPAGNAATPVTRTVTVLSAQGLSIVLNGANPLPLECKRDWYSEPGATAVDGCSGPSSAAITIDHPYIDSNTPATYSVSYRAQDSAGTVATAVRQVVVQDTLAPEIFLNGQASMAIECKAGTYVEQGATATDLCSGDLTSAITFSGAVNPNATGAYPVLYRVQDGSGRVAEKVRDVKVVDTRAPTITLEGTAVPELECSRDGFLAMGATATDLCAGDITSRITVSGTQNIVAPGTYPITYNVTDPSGNAAQSVTRSVTVKDTKAPVLTINGEADMTLECGVDIYTELGAKAYDACQGDLTSQVRTYGNGANPSAVGTYSIQYGVWDASGNTSMALRTVKVVDRLPPTITLVGSSVVQHECASGSFVDPGATAKDVCYGDLTLSINKTGSVNAWTRGSYAITYNVQDSTLLKAPSVTRTVQVVDTVPPTVDCRENIVWPADQSMKSFSLADCVTATDACDGYAIPNNGTILSISSDEPEDVAGDSDGSTTGDIVITGKSTFSVRAERRSDGDGRVYAVTFVLKDQSGNARTGQCKIRVPVADGGLASDSGSSAGYSVQAPQQVASSSAR
ncbi:immunoglobulin-like domain-containing protein [Hyalangium versicolor]|uniref:immunoglobulin-like domain-containing protein n=1 Tax=Hyalangium versicolor TaxID=2861190 RepID=UPI001CCA65F5|nr:immunoglobulin-like domain-containing protein [Hyalangium versicolor]